MYLSHPFIIYLTSCLGYVGIVWICGVLDVDMWGLKFLVEVENWENLDKKEEEQERKLAKYSIISQECLSFFVFSPIYYLSHLNKFTLFDSSRTPTQRLPKHKLSQIQKCRVCRLLRTNIILI